MSKNIIILGGGMVGSAIARDLIESNYSVTVADWNEGVESYLSPFNINYIKLDFLNNDALKKAIDTFNLVIGAVPGFMGYNILETVIKQGKNIVDISFMSEDSRKLTYLAKQNEVTAITDAGVAPGLSNLLFGRALFEFNKLHSANCYVGGLPQNPKPPWWYKSVFSPIDVIEEYTRPARFVVNGKIIIKPAMTDIEEITFDNVGVLEAFNSDGLRSLLDMPIPNMVEKTLRYPGHIQKIIDLKNNGYFALEKINNTAKSLINDWASEIGDYDQTIMRLEFSGIKDGKEINESFELIDYFDKQNNITSMARTTGYTCAAVASIILSGDFKQNGVFTLEKFGEEKRLVDNILHYLSERNVQFNYSK